MTLERKFIGNDTVVDKVQIVTANLAMTVRDQVVRVSASPATGALTITLPSVASARGMFFSILCRDGDATNTVTVEDKANDSEYWNGDFTMNGPGDKLLFYSDGMTWVEISDLATHTGTTAAPTTA